MNIYILGFLVLCLMVGLWAPRKLKVPTAVLALTAALVAFLALVTSKL